MRTFTEMEEDMKKLRGVKTAVEEFLRDETKYNFASRAADKKPESVFQKDLVEHLKDKYKVEAPFIVKTSKQGIHHTLNEEEFRYDLKIEVGKYEQCLIELKYDEEQQDGSSTNSNSEDEVKRDIYKLQSWKTKKCNTLCLIVFATNKASHWENFTSIQSGKHEINYNSKNEKFTLLYPYKIEWKKAQKNSQYRYCIIIVDVTRL